MHQLEVDTIHNCNKDLRNQQEQKRHQYEDEIRPPDKADDDFVLRIRYNEEWKEKQKHVSGFDGVDYFLFGRLSLRQLLSEWEKLALDCLLLHNLLNF